MKVGKVVGAIWATRKAACLQGQTFLVVESNGERIVAADQVGAGTGRRGGQNASAGAGASVCVRHRAGLQRV